MPKIKEITISNFRAYLGEHKFSFVGKNGIANLVVIYGPNGFGKTSFFDAVEFTLSDSIRRFEGKNAKSEIDSRDFADNELKLLSHRSATTEGEVKILTEDNKQIKRVANRRKLPNGPYYDYKRGVLSSDIPETELISIYNTNLLSQDQIDSFLRLLTPEEKFSELQEFWPQGAKAAEVFKKLAKYRRLLKASLLDTEKNITSFQDDINKFLNTEDKLDNIRKTIRVFNNNTVFPLKYPELSKDISEEIYASVVDLNQSNKKLIDNKLNGFPALQLSLDSLIDKHRAYLKSVGSLKEKEAELIAVSLAKKKNVEVRVLRGELDKNGEKIERIKNSYASVEILLAQWPDYLESVALIIHLQAENESDLRQKETLLNNIGIYVESESTLRSSLRWNREKLESALRLAREMDAMEKGIKKQAADEIMGLEILEFLEGAELEIDARIDMLQDRRSHLQMVQLEWNAPTPLSDFDYYQSALQKNELNLQHINTDLDGLVGRRDQQKTFEDRLNTILDWGMNQVREQQLSSCLMCNTAFPDVSILLESMHAEHKSILDTSGLAESIVEVAGIRLHLKEEKFLLQCQMEELEAGLLDEVTKEISAAFQDREQIYKRRSDVEGKVRYAADYAERCLNDLQSGGLSVEGFGNDFSAIRGLNDEQILGLKTVVDRVERVIEFKSQRQQELELELTLSKLRKENNNNRIELIMADPAFQRLASILEKFTLRADQINFQILQDGLNKLSADEQGLINTQVLLEEHLAGLLAKIELSPVNYQTESSEILMENLADSIAKLKEDIQQYQNTYRLMSDDEEFGLEAITIINNAFKIRVEAHQKLKEDLEKFTIELEVIRENLKLADLKSRLSGFVEKRQRTDVAKGKVDRAHIACGEFINLGIEEHFNTEVINRIYGKIDPHPGLKEIEIKSEISEDDKAAKLQIRAKNEFDRVNPVFYFSTGQVNVLSLSIFLAKAFELGGEVINTIFMDDPVQNLSDINVLSFIDLLRTLIEEKDRQIVISTHDEKFFRLLQNKLSDDYFKAKYFELVSYGEIRDTV